MILNEPRKTEPEPVPPKRDWLYIFSPCFITGIIALIWSIYWYITFEQVRGWSILGVIFGVIGLVIMILADLIVKGYVGKKTVKVWIIEISIIIGVIILFILYIYTL